MNESTVQLIGYKLREHGFKNLKEYYESESWLLTKKKAIETNQSKNQCVVCLCKHSLELHHKSYKTLCEENLDHLIWLCNDCHGEVHKLVEKKGWSVWYATKKFRRASNLMKRRKTRVVEDKKKIQGGKHMKGLIKTRYAAKSKDLNVTNCNPVTVHYV